MKYNPILRKLRDRVPRTPNQLWHYIKFWYGVEVPKRRVCRNHNAPFEYIVGSFFDSKEGWSAVEKRRYSIHRNCVVCANRSGGKTMGGGLVTHLDSTHKPGCGTRILGGSGLQSQRMHEEKKKFDWRAFADRLRSEPSKSRTYYTNESYIEILTQSQKSVRGTHAQKVKLDEVDEFDLGVYKAALGIAQGTDGIPGSLEKFSTVHRVGGLMTQIIDEAEKLGDPPLYRWCVFEVLKTCPFPCTKKKPYARCLKMFKVDSRGTKRTFWDVCQLKAKRSDGYYELEDLWDKFRDMPWETFASEMLCLMPKRDDLIYPAFDIETHVLEEDFYSPEYPMIMGLDAGYHSPFAVWAIVLDDDAIVRVREFAPHSITTEDFVDEVERIHVENGYQKLLAAYNDPASRSLNVLMNRKPHLFRENRLSRCYGSKHKLREGYEAMRRRFEIKADEDGEEVCGSYYSPSCIELIRQLQKLRSRTNSYDEFVDEQIKEDDHGCDADRYMVKGWDQTKAKLLAHKERPSTLVI